MRVAKRGNSESPAGRTASFDGRDDASRMEIDAPRRGASRPGKNPFGFDRRRGLHCKLHSPRYVMAGRAPGLLDALLALEFPFRGGRQESAVEDLAHGGRARQRIDFHQRRNGPFIRSSSMAPIPFLSVSDVMKCVFSALLQPHEFSLAVEQRLDLHEHRDCLVGRLRDFDERPVESALVNPSTALGFSVASLRETIMPFE